MNTTGAILLTNDGALCYRLTHPRFQIARVYMVRVRGQVDEPRMRRLARMSGTRTGPGGARPVELVKALGKETILRITLREGRHRQVRRMCEAVGLRVMRLKRVQFGPITIRKLPRRRSAAVREKGNRETTALGIPAGRLTKEASEWISKDWRNPF